MKYTKAGMLLAEANVLVKPLAAALDIYFSSNSGIGGRNDGSSGHGHESGENQDGEGSESELHDGRLGIFLGGNW